MSPRGHTEYALGGRVLANHDAGAARAFPLWQSSLEEERAMNERQAETNEEHAETMRELQSAQRDAVRKREIERGVLLVHTGDGKGKSTAGFGVALRAVGAGQRVAIVQFIKGAWRTGEQDAIQRFPEITHVVSGDGFTWDTQDREKDITSAERGWSIARSLIAGGEHDVVVLDELCVALSYDYLDASDVVAELLRRPENVSVVATGRGAPTALVEAADTVTEHVAVKHAYAAGIRARRGVEF